MEKSNIDPDQRLTFLANTVHEIRTPVQTIIGTLELLSDTHLNNEQQEYVRQIQFSTNVLLSLVNHLDNDREAKAGKTDKDHQERKEHPKQKS